MPRFNTSPTRAKGEAPPGTPVPPRPDHGENSASTVIEAPQSPKTLKRKLDPHDFPDGGGSGGAESFSRKRLNR